MVPPLTNFRDMAVKKKNTEKYCNSEKMLNHFSTSSQKSAQTIIC